MSWNPVTAIKDFFSKSPSREEAAKKLEEQHKMLFLYLVDATNLYFNLLDSKKGGVGGKNAVPVLLAGQRAAKSWLTQQKEFEAAGVPVFRPTFFDRSKRAEINKVAVGMRSAKGVGFVFLVPLVWFGVVALGAWASTKIVDMLTTTTQEQEALLNTAQETCKKLNLSPEDCKNLINKEIDQSREGSGFGQIVKIGGFAIGAYLLSNLIKSKATA